MRKATKATIVIVLAGLAAFAWTQRRTPPEATQGSAARAADAPAVAAAVEPESHSRSGAMPAPSTTNRRAPLPAIPLPSEGTPLAEIHDMLAARARAGDNAAAMRLVFDLTRCSSRAGADAEALDALDAGARPLDDGFLARLDPASRRTFEEDAAKAAAFCRGVTSEKVEKRGEWLLLAAERGDAEAMVCFAAAPNDFAPPLLGDAWFDWSRRWRERAPAFIEAAYAAGRVNALPLLAEALSGDTYRGNLVSTAPLASVLRPDPVRAAAYALVASRLGYGDVESANRRRLDLDEPMRSMAQAIAERDMQRFNDQTPTRSEFLPCRRLYSARRMR